MAHLPKETVMPSSKVIALQKAVVLMCFFLGVEAVRDELEKEPAKKKKRIW